MANCLLPIMYLNLGGEMIYIIHQRLHAQNVPDEKSRKVMCDLVSKMLDERCLQEVFIYNVMYKKDQLRIVFDRLAHSSIMRLNTNSMDKLYDLMLMAVKYQIVLSRKPEELLLITMNHLDGMSSYVRPSQTHLDRINTVCMRFKEYYAKLSAGQMWRVRQFLLAYFQDMNKRVSVFLKDKLQLQNGRFVIPPVRPVSQWAEVPGSIKYFKNDVLHLTHKFVPPPCYLPPQPLGSLEMEGKRGTGLGLNMYDSTVNMTVVQPKEEDIAQPMMSSQSGGKMELTLLGQLIGVSNSLGEDKLIRLSLFDEEDDESLQSSRVIRVTTEKTSQQMLSSLMEDFDVQSHDTGADKDLFDLLKP